ncbi:hypothetical protein Bca4012_050888 [Brassica carinata]
MIFRYHGSTLISTSFLGIVCPGETEVEFSTRLVKNAEDLINKEGPETIGAFIAEPVMVAVRVIPPPAIILGSFCTAGPSCCLQYDILLIAVEVSGTVSSTYADGAILMSQKVADVMYSQSNKLGDLSHGFTYSAHPFSCAIAIEALKTYK